MDFAHRQPSLSAAPEVLAQLRRQYDLILNTVGVGIRVVDQQGLIVFANPEAARLLGWPLEELIGKPAHHISHHTKADGTPYPREECPIYLTCRDGVVYHVDTDLFWRRDGTSFPVAYTSTPLRDEEGHIIGTVLSFRDISECKRAQDTLVAEARFLRAQTDVARVSMSSLQPEVLMPSLLEAISHAQGYAFGLFWRVLEAEQTATVEATFGAGTAPFQSLCFNVNDGDLLTAQAIRTRQPAFCNHLQQSHFATQRISQARGTKALVVLPLIDRTGKVIGALSFGDSEDPERFTERDLTQGMVLAGQVAQAMENSELFRRVQQLEAQYRVVTESLNDAVYTTDHEGRITFGNAALECLTGYRRDVLLGLPSPGLYSVNDQPVLQERRREVFKGAALPPVEVEVLCSDGRRVACELSGTPLLGDGQIIGGVGVLRDITARNQAAQEAERRRQEAEVLAELARSVSASLDLDTVLMRVTEGARTVCRSDAASLALRDPHSEAMLLRYWNGARWPEGEALRVEPGQGVGGQVLLTGRPFRTDHYTEDSRISPNFRQVAFLRGLAAVMAVPIWIGGRMEGILYVANCAPQPFTDHDEAILQRLADQAAIAMQNARLYQQQARLYAQAERRRAAAESLTDLARLLSESLDPAEVGQRIVDAIRPLLGAKSALLYQLEQRSGDLRLMAVCTDGASTLDVPQVMPQGTNVAGLAVRERRPTVSPNILADPRLSLTPELRAYFEQLPPRTVLSVPLMLQDEVIGVLGIGDDAGREFPAEEIQLVQAFVTQAATALRNARLYQEAQEAYRQLSQTQAQFVQAQKMEAVGRLAGGVAHDFNNLLTIITGRTQLQLMRLPVDHPVRRDLELIHSAAARAATLTGQLLAFSRRQILQPQVLDLNALVHEVSLLLRRLIGEDIAFVTVLDPVLGQVRADPGQLEQVLFNLAINARDAMPQGGQLTLQTANIERHAGNGRGEAGIPPGRYVQLRIRDTGIGMDSEVRAHLFEPFFTTKEVGKGTGLGLATVYGIVTQSGGYIAVDTAPGWGTTFTLSLPRVDDAPAATPSDQTPAALLRGQATILLVEDDADVRDLACDILTQTGYRVLRAGSGAEALQHCEQHAQAIDLVLTDVVMPGMSGRDLAGRVMHHWPRVKILYMSGYTDEMLGRHGALDPSISFLEKPFSPESLTRKVREVLAPAGPAMTR